MKYLLLFLLFIGFFEIRAQHSFLPKPPKNITFSHVIDSGTIRIMYVVNQFTENPKDSEDVHVLEIGENFSKYYSYNLFRRDSIYTYYLQKNPNAREVPDLFGRDITRNNRYFWSEYYKNYSQKTLSEYAYMPKNITNYQYTEPIQDFKWVIHEDTLTIATYLCQKATCFFRGKNYTAWFCTNIPINEGPWKFEGLPGLILKIYDDNCEYVFTCVSIELHRIKYPIIMYDYKNYKIIERIKLVKLWVDIFDHYYQMIGSTPWSRNLSYHSLELK